MRDQGHRPGAGDSMLLAVLYVIFWGMHTVWYSLQLVFEMIPVWRLLWKLTASSPCSKGEVCIKISGSPIAKLSLSISSGFSDNLLVPSYTPGWRGAWWELSVMLKSLIHWLSQILNPYLWTLSTAHKKLGHPISHTSAQNEVR